MATDRQIQFATDLRAEIAPLTDDELAELIEISIDAHVTKTRAAMVSRALTGIVLAARRPMKLERFARQYPGRAALVVEGGDNSREALARRWVARQRELAELTDEEIAGLEQGACSALIDEMKSLRTPA